MGHPSFESTAAEAMGILQDERNKSEGVRCSRLAGEEVELSSDSMSEYKDNKVVSREKSQISDTET